MFWGRGSRKSRSGGNREFAKSPPKGKKVGGKVGVRLVEGGGRGYIRKRCTFPVAFTAEKGKAKTEKRRPKEGNAVLCKLS